MATNFKHQFPGSGQLPHRLRKDFYQTMKQTVVVVRVYNDATGVTNWGGVRVGPEGLVVTAAHFLLQNPKAVTFRCHSETEFIQAKVLYTDQASNLALLRRVGSSRDIHYAECCSWDDIRVGNEAIAIGHPCNLVYTIAIGHVAFPANGIDDPFEDDCITDKTCNKRRFVDCKFGEDCEEAHLKILREDLHIIQLNNIHGSMSSAGSGIFNSVGLLMGIEIFVLSNFDFCVHVSTLQKFFEEGLEVEKTKGLMEIQRTKYCNTEEKRKAKGRIEGKTVSVTKLTTEREHVKPHNTRPLVDKKHTLTSKYCWKKTFESDQGTSTIADSDERTWLDGGLMKISSGKSVTVKNQIKFDVESAPQNKTKFHSDMLDKCELSGDFARLPSFEMDMLELDFCCPLKKTENAEPNVSFLPDSGDGSTASPKQLCTLYSGDMKSMNICPGHNNSVQFTRGLSGKMSATRTSKETLLNPFSSIATRKHLPKISLEQDISLRDRGLYDITNLKLPATSKSNINTSSFTRRRETKQVRFSESKLEVLPNAASKTVCSAVAKKYTLSSLSMKRKISEETETNPDSLSPSCITNFITKKRLLLQVSPKINQKLKASPPIDKKLVLGIGHPEANQGNAFMDNFGYSNCVPEIKSMANFELPILMDGNVEKAEACAQELDDEWEMDPESSKHRMATSTERRELEGILSTVDKKLVLGSGYADNFCEEESGCSKYMVDVQLPGMSESPKLNLNPSNESARELDDLSTYLKLNSGSVEKALACARELDDICNMLRKKNEEVKELLACSIAIRNALMLLNHPMYDDKISLFLP